MNRARLTVVTDEATVYSYLVTDEYWEAEEFEHRAQTADYSKADCNDPKSLIYGWLESLGQSDDMPPILSREAITSARIEWIGSNPALVGFHLVDHIANLPVWDVRA